MFSTDKNIESIAQLVEELKRYTSLRTEYLKYDVVEKTVRLLTVTAISICLLGLLSLALIYLSFATAYALSHYIGLTWAFAAVGIAYVLALLVIIIMRHRWIERPLVKFLAGILLTN